LRVLPQDAGYAQRLTTAAGERRRRFALDLLDQGRDPFAVGLGREVSPTGQRRELEGLLGGVLEPVEVFSLL
jgi:hypothetical protein